MKTNGLDVGEGLKRIPFLRNQGLDTLIKYQSLPAEWTVKLYSFDHQKKEVGHKRRKSWTVDTYKIVNCQKKR